MSNDLELKIAAELTKQMNAALSLTLLRNAKSGVRNCANALVESATPVVRTTLRGQLSSAIAMQEEITDLMIKKGWFHPTDLQKQIQMDIESSNSIIQIVEG